MNTPEVIKTQLGDWDVEMGVNMDGELVIYTERLDGKQAHVHKLGEGSFTNETGEVFAGALFYIDE